MAYDAKHIVVVIIGVGALIFFCNIAMKSLQLYFSFLDTAMISPFLRLNAFILFRGNFKRDILKASPYMLLCLQPALSPKHNLRGNRSTNPSTATVRQEEVDGGTLHGAKIFSPGGKYGIWVQLFISMVLTIINAHIALI